jgi:hypothetical protein
MADVMPWEEEASAGKPAGDVMPWEEGGAKPSVAEDLYKTAGPTLLRGALGVVTTPGTLRDAAMSGVDWAFHKIAPETAANLDKHREELKQNDPHYQMLLDKQKTMDTVFPNASTAIRNTENNITGPLYHAQTGGGQLGEKFLELIPGIAAGGEGALPTLLKAGAGAVGSQYGAEAGKAAAPHLPAFAQPYAERAGDIIGTSLGVMTPAGARRAVTPLPVNDNRAATLTALQGENFPMTAGQATDRPWLRRLEGRTGLVNIPEQQERAFTEGILRRSGSTPPGPGDNWLGRNTTGADLGALRTANAINPTEAAAMQQRARAARAQFATDYGGAEAAALDPAIRAVSTVRAPAMNIPGTRYEMVRGQLQDMTDAASGHTRQAISQMRGNLDQAFYNSVPPNVAQRARDLQTQYANYQTIRTVHPEIGRDTITPQQVLNAQSPRMGRGFVNEEHGTLAPYAQQAGSVMQELPKPVAEHTGPFTKLAGAGLGALLAKEQPLLHIGGAADPLLGFIAGREGIGPMMDFAKNTGARAVVPLQGWLGNQRWRPDPNTQAPNVADLVRILSSTQGVQ